MQIFSLYKIMTYRLFIAVFSVFLVACSQEQLPFQYRYLSPDEVDFVYKGQRYQLSKSRSVKTPFKYNFEQDGDLDIVIDGVEYEIESPFDVDRKKKKKTAKVKKINKS